MNNTKYYTSRPWYILCTLYMVLCTLSSCGLYGKYHPEHPEADTITTPAYTDIFTDPHLQSLIEKALLQNLDLKMAHERVNQARAQHLGSKLAYLPTVGLSGEGGYAGTRDASSSSYQVGAVASLSLDIFGRLYNQMQMAGMTRLSAQDEEALYRTELIASVATYYYTLLMLDEQILTVDSIAATFRSSVEALKAMKQAGMTDESSVAQFEGNFYGVAAQAKELRLVRHEAENALRLLLSDPDYGEIRRSGLYESMSDYDLTTVPLSAVWSRPDVRLAEHQLARAFYGVQLSRANCCPDISLSGLVGFDGGLIWSAVGKLLQPLFNSGRNIAEVRTAKSARQEAEYRYQSVLMKAGVEVNDALAARRSYVERTQDYAYSVAAFERAYEATSTKFRLGQGSYLETLIALQHLLNARVDLISNYSNILISQVNLYLSLGGGR